VLAGILVLTKLWDRFCIEMPRFPRNNVQHFLAKPGATVHSPINDVRYIGLWLAQQIANIINGGPGGPIPTVKQTLNYILGRCEQLWQAQHAHQIQIGSTNKILEAVVASLVPNQHALSCTADDEFAPITNRMGFDALVDLVAYDKGNPATFAPLTPNANMFRTRLQGQASILRHVVCNYQEGSPPSSTDPNYICDNSVAKATVGTGAFARSLRRCACMDQGTCNGPLCEWIGNADGAGNGACVSDVRQFGDAAGAPRYGRRTRFVDGTEFTDVRRGTGSMLMPPPPAYQHQGDVVYDGAAPYKYYTKTG